MDNKVCFPIKYIFRKMFNSEMNHYEVDKSFLDHITNNLSNKCVTSAELDNTLKNALKCSEYNDHIEMEQIEYYEYVPTLKVDRFGESRIVSERKKYIKYERKNIHTHTFKTALYNISNYSSNSLLHKLLRTQYYVNEGLI
ncbi:Hypothetical protein ORPV_537 [Orpheovirus IHUMI-LCC2]|uniref:Uncharacterized protein n=1 Tax=Orpheovirus IHUMI-LCC2 TaxID=2023057 RepID=A0A2I2L4K4_9VIRU|nr:Hypothetical protein ORPV_537 [Orpheovirus IHUMI-LCC2]SNW62441.1 Hypothetical protein ORPV_537 [Orpheovirus IHUMI-LCC2]